MNSFKPINLKVNYSDHPNIGTGRPVFCWGAEGGGKRQSAYRIRVYQDDTIYWDTGFVKSDERTAIYGGKTLPCGKELAWEVQIKDETDRLSRKNEARFVTAYTDTWKGKWISSPNEKGNEALYFKKRFVLKERPCEAVFFHSAAGIEKSYINGVPTNDHRMEPGFTNYKKRCLYVTDIIDKNAFYVGENCIDITACGGWRKNGGRYLSNMSKPRGIEFMGNICIIAQLVLRFADGSEYIIATDDTWDVSNGQITNAHLFDGETYNERVQAYSVRAVYSDFATEKLVPDILEPICVKHELKPVNSYSIDGHTIYDFGENLVGVVRLRAKGRAGDLCSFTLRHAERLRAGELYTAPLRGAAALDKYICCSGDHDIDYAPQFTYHGFRYAELTVSGEFEGDIEVTALNFYNDIDSDGFFRCSDTVANSIYDAAIRTERSNIHSIATDCPQRDERMAWMNDATVRFMSMPYNFCTTRLFEKILNDIADEQDSEGRITCTAPFLFGERPADPVCSAYLVAAREHYKLTGSRAAIESHYDGFKRWCKYLKSREICGIIDYSYYGDWAGPEDSCVNVEKIGDSDVDVTEGFEPGAAHSKNVPGKLVSTAMHYLNYRIMTEFAALTGRSDDVEVFSSEARRVQKAYLTKWVVGGRVYNGSQGTQAISLFVDILPESVRSEAAAIMAQAVENDGRRITTGNIITPMLFDMLSKYGYQNLAWELFTRTEYPSLGNMISYGATTLWERYEFKDDAGMNSHNHPMHGATVGWLYRSLAGFSVKKPQREYLLAPNIPDKLNYFEMRIPVICGGIYIKYERASGEISIDIPFGLRLRLFYGEEYLLEAGYHIIKYKGEIRHEKN